MKVIDFICLGVEDIIYVISSKDTTDILWRGTRQDFVREMSAFFLFFHQTVLGFDVDMNDIVILYI